MPAGYYGAEDTDGSNIGTVTDNIELLWSGIDTECFTNLSLSIDLAEDDSTDGFEDWDSTSSFRIEVDDGSGFSQIFRVSHQFTDLS